jgi:hypothetical protein
MICINVLKVVTHSNKQDLDHRTYDVESFQILKYWSQSKRNGDKAQNISTNSC